jgi:hypothetical protein
MTFEEARAIRDRREAEARAAGDALKAFPKDGPMGLTPDHIKFSPEFRAAKARYDDAWLRLRDVNHFIRKRFAKDVTAARRSARQ